MGHHIRAPNRPCLLIFLHDHHYSPVNQSTGTVVTAPMGFIQDNGTGHGTPGSNRDISKYADMIDIRLFEMPFVCSLFVCSFDFALPAGEYIASTTVGRVVSPQNQDAAVPQIQQGHGILIS